MKHIFQKKFYINQTNFTKKIFHDTSIFFDIETTGFSPVTSFIYLIGCLRRQNDTLIIDQFLAESKEDEKEILEQFINLLSEYDTILSFNGIGFDLPFIKAKCNSYKITNSFDAFQYIDLFKETSKLKPILKLDNYKQKTVEEFLGIQREDRYSGGELIPIYEEYQKTHDSYAEELLLLHNFDDVVGMLDLLPILSYARVLNGEFQIKSTNLCDYTSYDGTQKKEMIITIENAFTLPKRISIQNEHHYIIFDTNETKVRVPVFEGELKFFYDNYKDYYYLPEEDLAIHKSVATFVDKNYRKKANAQNCYTRKDSCFLPQFKTFLSPVFKQNYKDKVTYLELSDDFILSDTKIKSYIEHIFAYVMQH